MRKLLVFVFIIGGFYANSQSICGGQSFTLQAPNPQALTGPTYSMQPGGFTSPTGSFNVSPNVTTTYTLYTTGQNTNSATQTTSFVTQLTVNPQPASNPTIVQASCTSTLNSVNLGLTFSPSAPSYTINWTPIPASVLSPVQTTASPLTPGPYTVAITAVGGCSTAVFFTINPAPAPAVFSVIPFGNSFSITCLVDTVQLVATNPNNTYTWTGASFLPIVNDTIQLTNTQLGTFTLVGQNTVSGCTNTYTYSLSQNTAVPTSSMSTSLINITCTQTLAPTLTVIATPSVNVTNIIYSPQGGTFSAASYTTIYYPGYPGTYTYVVRNDVNGCTAVKHFTVASSDNYPTFNVTSPQNFTLGCTTKSVANIVIVNAATTPSPGGPVSYTVIGPPTSTAIASGTLSGNNNYTVNVPGTWTVMVKDNTNNCISSSQVSILTNTLGPTLDVTVPISVLTCDQPSVTLEAVSETPNVNYTWNFNKTPGTIVSYSLLVNNIPTAPTQTLVDNFTLTITDLNNTCKTTSTVPIFQNLYVPTASASAQNNASITCNTPTLTLSNQSKTGIPPGSIFPANLPVIAYLWEGPTPQEPLQVNSTYVAGINGVYTITAKDLNNGCFSKGTYTVFDGRVYPQLVTRDTVIDCGASNVKLVVNVLNPSPNITYSWTAPTATSQLTGQNTQSLTISFPGTYTVLVTNPVNGCKSTTVATATSGSLTASFTTSQDSGYAPLSITLINTSSSTSNTNNVSASWNFGNGTTTGSTSPTGSFTPGPISNTQNPVVVYNQPGTYTITMYSTKGVCLDTAYHVIKVEVPSTLTVPNIFSPNGDGVNDLFFLKSTNLSEISMKVVDRWGHVVYDLTSKTGNIEWDGKNPEGKDSASGVYFYTIKATGTDGVSYDKKGTLTIVR